MAPLTAKDTLPLLKDWLEPVPLSALSVIVRPTAVADLLIESFVAWFKSKDTLPSESTDDTVFVPLTKLRPLAKDTIFAAAPLAV